MNSGNAAKKEQIKSKLDSDNLKSDYFFQKLFDIMKKNQTLEIIKYNKKLQERLNLTIDDYKKYSQIYSPIEIELIPDDEYYYNYKFINISETDKAYYHIYLNNSKTEIKRNYLEEDEKVEMIKIIIDYQVESLSRLFYNCNSISSIFFKRFNRTNITNMSFMFYGCSSLKELNISKLKTNNVIDMSWMFSGCSSLNELNISNFYTNNVTKMKGMFFNCSSIKELNISHFNTDKVWTFENMFEGCSALKELNIFNFNFSKEANVNNMFKGCSDELKEKIKEQNKNINI